MQQPYDEEFFKALKQGARRSAGVIVPMVMDLLQPASVIDLGCGTGTWLSVFKEHGAREIRGVDGDYVNRAMLDIPQDCFTPADLQKPFRLDSRFDLACSMEVAEHLPKESAQTFVESLTGLAPAVLFSAAVPHQGGAEHVNEQWQDCWAALFEACGYLPVDCIRRKVWSDQRVDYWYAQNMLLYVTRDVLNKRPKLRQEYEFMGTAQLRMIHPNRYLEWVQWGLEQGAKAAPR